MLAYLLAAAGVAWRALRGRPCACASCRGHRAFIRESATAYRAEVRSLTGEQPAVRLGADLWGAQ
jgi:hypothetical protein